MVLTMVNMPGKRFMHTIKASEFKAKCLALMDEVARTGRTQPRPKSALGVWKDRLIVKGGIISPLDVEWDALK